MSKQRIIIGARGSKLSLIQTEIIKDLLQSFIPDITIDVEVITTTGDKNMNPIPLDTVGKGWFTKEIDKALLEKRIDLAVHSLKDLPEQLPEGLLLAAIPAREDAREALVTNTKQTLSQLPPGAVVGTDSTRRKAQILHQRPDVVVKSLRGNVNTRLAKLDAGEYTGIFLAVAGLKRLGMENRISEYFAENNIIPSPGQGALAVVIRETDTELLELLKQINDTNTVAAVKAERAFSKAVGGGCKMPVGAYARVENQLIILHGMIGSPDGQHVEKAQLSGPLNDPQTIGESLAAQLLKQGKSWYTRNVAQYVIITRPDEDKELAQEIQKFGLQVLPYPTIKITKNQLDEGAQFLLRNLETYDWIIFTSKNGVRFFFEELERLQINQSPLRNKYIACVGTKTAAEVEKFGYSVHFIPSEFTTAELANQLKDANGKKVLMARSTIANPLLTEELQKKGALVDNIPIYKTEYITNDNNELNKLIKDQDIACITFTSPSTVEGFMHSIDSTIKEQLLTIPILSIGPVTTNAVATHGFTIIYTAREHTTNGILSQLQESIL